MYGDQKKRNNEPQYIIQLTRYRFRFDWSFAPYYKSANLIGSHAEVAKFTTRTVNFIFSKISIKDQNAFSSSLWHRHFL